MSVRYINASLGEYISVHREGVAVPESCGDTDILTVVGIIAAILAVAFFWEIILKAIFFACAVLLAVALAAGGLYLLWTFRRELWHGTCWAAEKIWNGICWAAPLLRGAGCWIAKTLWRVVAWILRIPLRSAASWCWAKCGTVCGTIRNRFCKRLNA